MKTFVFDLDGVIYLGADGVPGVGTVLRQAIAEGHQVLFATNGSASVPEVIARKVSAIAGMPIPADWVLTSALATANYLQGKADRVFVMGGEGVFSALEDRSIATTTSPLGVDAVVVGIDKGLSYDRLSKAVSAALDCQLLVGTNSDVTYPTPEGLRPGGGTLARAVSIASGVDVVFAGKPFDPMLAVIRERILHEEVWMIGDRPDTDLALARRAGWKAALTLTGVTESAEDVAPSLRPDAVLNSVADLGLLL